MPLYDTGSDPAPSERGPSYRAKDENDTVVVVSVSQEAEQDFDAGTIWQVASDKYDRKDLESAGPPPRVRVTTADCKPI